MVKIITANVNGIRAAIKKGFWDFIKDENPDYLCIQELKARESDLTEELINPLNLYKIWHSAQKPGYSGVAIYSKIEPDCVQIGMGLNHYDIEGRYIRADYNDLSIISLYMPSGSSSQERQDFKFLFLEDFFSLLEDLDKEKKKWIITGDWNIAHQNIDLKNYKGNQKNSGFLPEERAWMTKVLQSGWVDSWRYLYPDIAGYTWWSNRGQAYQKDVGWRIDYQIISQNLVNTLVDAHIYKEVKFSDHAPLIMNYSF